MIDLEGTLRSSIAGRYHVEGEIGHGGMSVVFRAHDLKHNRTVAVKVLRPELSQQIGAERFQREIEFEAGLAHPHILPLHDSGDADGLLYFVMPFVEGGSLRTRIETEGPLPESDALRIVREIADALDYAHEQGVVHRDIKPGNILLSGDHALLADFGIAHLADDVLETLTETGIALGTPAYLSPEQASGTTDIDGRSDIYALGCVLYEALTGSAPFEAPNVRAMLVKQMLETPPPVRSLRSEVSAAAESVVETAIRKEPGDRFQTGRQMAEAIDLALGRFQNIPARMLRRFGIPDQHVDRAMIAIAVVTALIAIAVVFGIRYMPSPGTGSSDRVPSYLVVDYSSQTASDSERLLAQEAANELRNQLRGWTSLRVVHEAALEGPTADLQVAGVAQSSFLFGTRLARETGADYLVLVQAHESGLSSDQAAPSEVSAVLIQAVRQDKAGRDAGDFTATGSPDSLNILTATIALDLLEIDGDPRTFPTLQARSPDHLAQQEFQAGRDALWRWRLAEAHDRLSAALARDSTFALAHHLLAETMYWETVEEPKRLTELGPIIEYHSVQADWWGTDERLRPLEQDAVDAFRAFWTGDYELARTRYDELIEADSTDLESLVLRGAVEFEDLMLADGEGGVLIPRQNLNVARAVFVTANRFNPKWELAWGQIHDIDRQIAQAAYLGWCYGFESPGDDLIPPWATREAAEQKFFCPIVQADTIGWTPARSGELPGDSTTRAGALAMHERTLELLERNTRVGLGQPRHHVALSDYLIWERQRHGCDASPFRSDSLRTLAAEHFSRALSMRGDTTPRDRLVLAGFELGRGNVDTAVAMTDLALEEMDSRRSRDGWIPPSMAANPLLAAGDAGQAVAIIEESFRESTASLTDPLDLDRSINLFGTYRVLRVLEALGTLGENGPMVLDRFDRLRRTWEEAPISARDRVALRKASLPYTGPALVNVPELWDDWFGGWSEFGLETPPVWQGVIAAFAASPDREAAGARLDEAVAMLGADRPAGRVVASDLYVPLVVARQIGATDVEREIRAMFDRCALKLDSLDPGWGMRFWLAEIN
ncbi:MAG: serine/threonine protein kinase [marine benthic group bacterium]|nr:serine/threonine protein kinase [Gemmatimonadota bacterium]